MLKIKDDVDLKELKKYGFKHWKTIWKENEDMDDQNEWCYDLKLANIDREISVLLIQIDDTTRRIKEYIDRQYECFCSVQEKRLNVLYDLIQAGIVEKADDKQ